MHHVKILSRFLVYVLTIPKTGRRTYRNAENMNSFISPLQFLLELVLSDKYGATRKGCRFSNVRYCCPISTKLET